MTEMGRWTQYPDYKDSGIEWLGEIPKHWDISALKRSVALVNVKVEGNCEGLRYIGMENVESHTGKLLDSDSELVTEGMSSAFEPTDVLFGKLRPYLAKAAIPDFAGRCSSELLVLRPEKLTREYLLYGCLSDAFIWISAN